MFMSVQKAIYIVLYMILKFYLMIREVSWFQFLSTLCLRLLRSILLYAQKYYILLLNNVVTVTQVTTSEFLFTQIALQQIASYALKITFSLALVNICILNFIIARLPQSSVCITQLYHLIQFFKIRIFSCFEQEQDASNTGKF